jgi:hypothetical protein
VFHCPEAFLAVHPRHGYPAPSQDGEEEGIVCQNSMPAEVVNVAESLVAAFA